MGMTNGRTICSKHDEIMTRSERISNLLSGQDSVPSFSDLEAGILKDIIENSDILQTFLSLLKDDADAVYRLAEDAKRDGISMEDGLDMKKEEIKSLWNQIGDRDKELEELRELPESLEAANDRITYLSSLLENQNA